MIMGSQMFLAGFLGELISRSSSDRNHYLIEKRYNKTVSSLRGVKCLVTAGPTYEAIDPVRFIGNRSSGKMGIAIAEDLAKRGAEVTLILGPSSEKIPNQIAKVVRVESADDMYQAVMRLIKSARLGIFSAAVADYRPRAVAHEK